MRFALIVKFLIHLNFEKTPTNGSQDTGGNIHWCLGELPLRIGG